MKIHLHEEQFDGIYHSACGRVDDIVSVIVMEDAFDKIPIVKRCFYCSRINWPKGGEPTND